MDNLTSSFKNDKWRKLYYSNINKGRNEAKKLADEEYNKQTHPNLHKKFLAKFIDYTIAFLVCSVLLIVAIYILMQWFESASYSCPDYMDCGDGYEFTGP